MRSSDGRPRIGITYDTDRRNPVKRRLFERVRSWADLTLLDPDERHPDIPEMDLDCYHMAAWSRAAFADFERATAAGIPTVNSFEGAVATEDRVRSMRACAERGLPVPAFEYGTADAVTLDPPVVLKPRHETVSGGHDLGFVPTGDLDFAGERVVQRYVAPRRRYKLFRVGRHVRSTRLSHPDGDVVETAVPARFFDLAAVVADLFDIAVFELDLLVHDDPYVIDVNPVVSLAGVADAVEVYEATLRTVCGRCDVDGRTD